MSRPVSGGEDIGVLLGVWAHPDDEAYASAALMALVRGAGHRVVVATATRGEHGTAQPETWPPSRLAAIREREMAASLAALDVHEHHWLGHHDGTLHRVAPQRGVDQIAELIEEVRPDTIVTFGPDGLTGHSDHQTVSGWVAAARQHTGRGSRLWHATLTPEFHRRWHDVNVRAGLWMPAAEPPCDPVPDLAFAVHCDQAMLDRKLVALRAHASQTAHLITDLGVERYRDWWASEAFIDADRRTDTRRLAA